MVMRHRFIAIEGNIGTGKTALAKKIAIDYNKRLLLEEFEDNSFLPKFYEDAARNAFPLEMSFLASRFNQLKRELFNNDLFDQGIVSDYIFFKCLIFSKINLGDDEYELYTRLFDIINLQVPKPDLLVYLHKPVFRLQENIALRGRAYEAHIADSYLENLQHGYFDYMNQQQQQKTLIIDTTQLDFIKSATDYEYIISLIEKDYEQGVTIV
jgi:deoxyadenosine/deoxycytidine kinase